MVCRGRRDSYTLLGLLTHRQLQKAALQLSMGYNRSTKMLSLFY